MRSKLSSGCDFVLVFQALTGAASVTFFANAPPPCTSHAGKGIFPDPGQNKTIPVLWEAEVESVLGTIRQEYKRALERSNPVYRPHVPDRKKIRKVSLLLLAVVLASDLALLQVFKCVKDCAAFMDLHDVKSLYTCYSICLFEVDPDSEDQHPY